MIGWNEVFRFSDLLLDAAIVSLLFCVALIARRFVQPLRYFLLPASLIAGFIGFLAGPAVADVLPFSTDRMGVYVYHLLALTFIAVGLRKPGNRTIAAIHIGFAKNTTLLLQGLIGIAIAVSFVKFVNPDLSPAAGMLLPLGFGMGPGIALSVGRSWEEYGIAGAGEVGLTIAALGFLCAYVVGVLLVRRGRRLGLIDYVDVGRTGVDGDVGEVSSVTSSETVPDLARQAPGPGAEVIETLTMHLVTIGAIYAFATWLIARAADGLIALGMETEIPVLWSLNFLWANLAAMAIRKTLAMARADAFLDELTVDRLVGFFADLLIACAVLAIGMTMAGGYLLPIALMCIVGAAATYWTLSWTLSRAFQDRPTERIIGLFGEQTGTVSSGLALIRISDPEFRTSVAQDQVLGSGTALALGFPLLLLINLPVTRYDGAIEGYLVVAGWMIAYFVVTVAAWYVFARLSKRNT